MKLFCFQSDPKENVFAPSWSYPISDDVITTVDFKMLAALVLRKEKIILRKPNSKGLMIVADGDGYTGLGKNSLTSHYKRYNLLDWKHSEIPKLKQAILKAHECYLNALKIPLYPQLYIQCWANVMRQGEQIKPHLHSTHPNSYLGGHIVVQARGTKTYYINPVNQLNAPAIHASVNTIGKISFFPSCVPHYTDVQTSVKPRITIAFDLFVNKKVAKHNHRRIR
jgi:hypothetical protein